MRLLDQTIDVKRNSRLLVTDYRVYFRVLIISVLLDAASTMYFMAIIGPERELNIVVRNLSLTYGIIIGPVVGKSIQVLAVWGLTIITPRLIEFICGITIFVNLLALLVNLQMPNLE